MVTREGGVGYICHHLHNASFEWPLGQSLFCPLDGKAYVFCFEV